MHLNMPFVLNIMVAIIPTHLRDGYQDFLQPDLGFTAEFVTSFSGDPLREILQGSTVP